MISIRALYRAYIKEYKKKRDYELRLRARFLAEEMIRIMKEEEDANKFAPIISKTIGFVPR